jgi:hypothetical protein
VFTPKIHSLGGKARAEKQSAEERRQRAIDAANKRWQKFNKPEEPEQPKQSDQPADNGGLRYATTPQEKVRPRRYLLGKRYSIDRPLLADGGAA